MSIDAGSFKPGVYTVRVKARDVKQGPQPFALVISAQTKTPATPGLHHCCRRVEPGARAEFARRTRFSKFPMPAMFYWTSSPQMPQIAQMPGRAFRVHRHKS